MNAEKWDKYLILTGSILGSGGFYELLPFRAGDIYEGEPTQAAESDVTLRRRYNEILIPQTLSVHISTVAKLEDIEADLLLAVESFDERLSIYQERRDHLEMGKRLEVGSKVLVQVESDGKIDRPGEIKFKGLMAGRTGIWFRIELESFAQQASDGSFGSIKYFNCENGKSVFVRLNEIDLEQRDDKNDDEKEEYKEMPDKSRVNDTMREDIIPDKGSKKKRKKPRRKKGSLVEKNKTIHEDTSRQFESERQLHQDTRKQFEGERQLHQDTRKQFESERQLDEDTSKQFESERQLDEDTSKQFESGDCQLHEDTRRQFESEPQLHEDASRQFESEHQLHEDMRRQFESERQLHEDTRRQFESERQLHEDTRRQFESERQLHEDTRRQFESERQLHEDTRRQFESERQLHEDTRRQFESEQQQHADTRGQLENEQQEHADTRGQLESKQQLHADTCRQLENEQQLHGNTRGQLESEQQQHAETRGQLESEQEDHRHTQEQLVTSQTALQEAESSQRDWILDRSEIEITATVLGAGGWGSVREGRFRGTDVAVKQIYSILNLSSEYYSRLFQREMQMAARCRHPCLLQFIGATNDNESQLFVTELLETSLRMILEERRELMPNEVTTISLDVARALNYLHLNRPTPIIHRDISSANVLLWKHRDSWRCKVSDYGTANFMHHCQTIGPGAPVYSAPEARTSSQTVKIDVFSYGVLLLEIHTREFPDPSRRNGQIRMVTNKSLKSLIRRCLAEDPDERPSMAEIIAFFENS